MSRHPVGGRRVDLSDGPAASWRPVHSGSMTARDERADRDADQATGLTDMDPDRVPARRHAVVDVMADYLAGVERYPVFPPIEPGSLGPRFPAQRARGARAAGGDPRRLRPRWSNRTPRTGSTRASWPTSRRRASGPGILGEMLTAALGQNPMLWRTSPIGTELEGVVVGWLARGRSACRTTFDGLLTDTASTSTLIALGAAREALGCRRRGRGPGRARRGGAASRLRLRARPQLHRQGVHDAGPRPGVASSTWPSTTPTRCARTRWRRRSPPIELPGIARWRSWPRSGRRRRRRSIRSPRSRTSPSARACGCTSTRPMPGRRAHPGAARRLRGLGARRFDRRSTRTSGCSRRSTRRCC